MQLFVSFLRAVFLLVLLMASGATAGWAQAPNWSVDPGQYENTLTATIEVRVDGALSTDPDDVLGAFVGETARGTARVDRAEGLFFLTVYGTEAGRTVRFRVYDASSDVVRTAERTLTFEPDATYGTPSSPFVLPIGEGAVPGVGAWTVTPAAYENTMSITATVFVGATDRPSEGPADRVAAFINGEVRGVDGPERVGGRNVFFLTVYGDPPDAGRAITLRYYDAEGDRVYPTTEASLSFEANGVKGTPGDPVSVVAQRPQTTVPGTLTLERIAPNPLDRATQVAFASERAGPVQLVLYDALGRRMRVLYRGGVDERRLYRRWLTIEGLSSGMYWLQLTGPRSTVTRRVVVVR